MCGEKRDYANFLMNPTEVGLITKKASDQPTLTSCSVLRKSTF